MLTLPLLLAILLGTIEFGNYFSRVGVYTALAQDAVRYGAKAQTQPAARIQTQLAAEQLLTDIGAPCGAGEGCQLRTGLVSAGGVVFVELRIEIPYISPTGFIPTDANGGGVVPPTRIVAQAVYPHVGSSIL